MRGETRHPSGGQATFRRWTGRSVSALVCHSRGAAPWLDGGPIGDGAITFSLLLYFLTHSGFVWNTGGALRFRQAPPSGRRSEKISRRGAEWPSSQSELRGSCRRPVLCCFAFVREAVHSFHTFQAVWDSEESRACSFQPQLARCTGWSVECVPILDGGHTFTTPLFSYIFRLSFGTPPAEPSLPEPDPVEG